MKNEKFDYKRFILLNRAGYLHILLWTIICGAIAGLTYFVVMNFFSGPVMYRTAALYYITFDREEFEAVHDYYNDYTWNDVLDSDRIAGRAAELLKITQKEVADATVIPTMSDIRMIWVYVDSDDEEKSELIQAAIGQALKEFSEDTEGFDSIDVWDGPDTAPLDKDYLIGRVIIAGLLFGFFVSTLVLLYKNATDRKIYTCMDVYNTLGIYPIGIITQDVMLYMETKKQLTNVLKDVKGDNIAVTYIRSFADIDDDDFDIDKLNRMDLSGKKFHLVKHEDDSFYEKLKEYDGILILIRYGINEDTMLKLAYENMNNLGIKCVGMMVSDMNRGFANSYYGK